MSVTIMSVTIPAGAILFTADKPGAEIPLRWKLISLGIGLMQRDQGERKSRARHVGGFPRGGRLSEIEVSEAAFPVWHTIPAEQALKDKSFSVWTVGGLSPVQRAILAAGYTFHDGQAYNVPRIVGMGIDHVVGAIRGEPCYVFRSHPFLGNDVCSSGIAEEVARVTLNLEPFGERHDRAQPDGMHNWCLDHEWLGLPSEVIRGFFGQVLPVPVPGTPKQERQRWTTWEECMEKGWA
jgi:hypothetical protein